MNFRFWVLPIVLLTMCSGRVSAAEDFQSCLIHLQSGARAAGVSDQVVDTVIPLMSLQERVLELDRKQPEFVQTFAGYLKTRVSEDRVAKGREMYRRYKHFLDQLSVEYGIPGQYLVAFWGLETNFGSYLGNMPTLDSLATLACDARRSEFFTTEFITALRLLERESLKPNQMRGSWAGAMGHTQFMPSAYLRYAIDGDGDGAINLWDSEKDALASGANFLMNLGWSRGLRWGREVSLPKGFDYGLAGKEAQPLNNWADLGVRQVDNGPLPIADISAQLLVPAGHEGPAFLVYDNFSVMMKWNRSEFYALSVGHLADRIAGGGQLSNLPVDQEPLTRSEVKTMQSSLNRLGYDAGEEDGIFGPASRNALSSYEADRGVISDGFPDPDILQSLQNDVSEE